MPRVLLTPEQAALKGADKKDPGRFRERKKAPKHEAEAGNAPAHLSEAAKAVWFEIQAYAIPGTTTAADRMAMESLANSFAEYRMAPNAFPTSRLMAMIKLLSLFGMTPVDRMRLGVVKEPEKNEFEGLDS